MLLDNRLEAYIDYNVIRACYLCNHLKLGYTNKQLAINLPISSDSKRIQAKRHRNYSGAVFIFLGILLKCNTQANIRSSNK